MTIILLLGCDTKKPGKDIWCKKEDITVDWRRIHNEELQNLYSLPYTVNLFGLALHYYNGICIWSSRA
jgi:hypothetical protein